MRGQCASSEERDTHFAASEGWRVVVRLTLQRLQRAIPWASRGRVKAPPQPSLEEASGNLPQVA